MRRPAQKYLEAGRANVQRSLDELSKTLFSASDDTHCTHWRNRLAETERDYSLRLRVEKACAGRLRFTCDVKCVQDGIMKTNEKIEYYCNPTLREERRKAAATKEGARIAAEQALRPFEDACAMLTATLFSPPGSIEGQKKYFVDLSTCNQSPDRRVCALTIEMTKNMGKKVPPALRCDGKAIPLPANHVFTDYDQACSDLAKSFNGGSQARIATLVTDCGAHPSKAMCETVIAVAQGSKKPIPAGLKCTGN